MPPPVIVEPPPMLIVYAGKVPLVEAWLKETVKYVQPVFSSSVPVVAANAMVGALSLSVMVTVLLAEEIPPSLVCVIINVSFSSSMLSSSKV